MAFSESLTVRILGDSSELQRELDSVLNRFDILKQRISETSTAARQFSTSFNRISQALGPLQQVSNLIGRIGQQLQAIALQPVVLNVGPALQSLNQLTQAANRAASAIHAIPAIGPAVGGFPVAPLAPGPMHPRQGFASGGLVAGPPGIDQVPAALTAGEYVIRKPVVESLGAGFLERLNANPNGVATSVSLRQPVTAGKQGISVVNHPGDAGTIHSLQVRPVISLPGPNLQTPRILSQGAVGASTTNHFGGISIQVTEQVDAESLLRNLNLQGIGRRIRQG